MKILAINTSTKKGIPKNPVNSVVLIENSGILDDAHANPTDPTRQVSLLSIESVEKQQKKLDKNNSKMKLTPGIFGENITTKGIDLLSLKIGDRIKLGKFAILEISRIGKICHTKCAKRRYLWKSYNWRRDKI